MAVLSEREKEILQLVANGFTNREISLFCDIHYNTVKNHLTTIYRKLHTESRIEAVIYAAYLGLIDLEIAQHSIKSRIKSRYLI
jgi:DNA-binding CsgD family transcriptional regulator